MFSGVSRFPDGCSMDVLMCSLWNSLIINGKNNKTFARSWYHPYDKVSRYDGEYLSVVGLSDDFIRISGYRCVPFESGSPMPDYSRSGEAGVIGTSDRTGDARQCIYCPGQGL